MLKSISLNVVIIMNTFDKYYEKIWGIYSSDKTKDFLQWLPIRNFTVCCQ